MACDYATISALLTGDGYDRLSARDVLMCIADIYGTAAGLNAASALALAQTNQYGKLSDRDLDEALLAKLCT